MKLSRARSATARAVAVVAIGGLAFGVVAAAASTASATTADPCAGVTSPVTYTAAQQATYRSQATAAGQAAALTKQVIACGAETLFPVEGATTDTTDTKTDSVPADAQIIADTPDASLTGGIAPAGYAPNAAEAAAATYSSYYWCKDMSKAYYHGASSARLWVFSDSDHVCFHRWKSCPYSFCTYSYSITSYWGTGTVQAHAYHNVYGWASSIWEWDGWDSSGNYTTRNSYGTVFTHVQAHFAGTIGWGPVSYTQDTYPWVLFHVRTNGQIFLTSGCVGC